MAKQTKRKIYGKELAALYKEGDPYRPSNGTEGMQFESLWCEDCINDNFDWNTCEGGCDIIARSWAFNINDSEYPKEWIHGADGQPKCTAFRTSPEATQEEMEAAGQQRFPEAE